MLAITKEGGDMTVEDALARLDKATQKDGHGNWDLSDLSMQPEFISDLVAKLPLETTGSWGGAVTLDLSENRLGNLDEQQLRQLARALKERPWLRVRFGYEVMAPRVVSALKSEGMEWAWGTQVDVDRPWQDPTNRRLAEALSSLAEGNRKVDEALSSLAEGNRKVDEALSCLAEGNRKVEDMMMTLLGEESHLPRGFIKGQADALEHEMAGAVRTLLVDSRIVAVSYKWKHKQQSRAGDVDAVVTGKLKDEPVVVICECKTNIQADVDPAVRKVKQNAKRWQELCEAVDCRVNGIPVEGEAGNPASQKDIDALSVAELRGRRVLHAIGGQIFPETMSPTISKRLKNKLWIRVRMNGMLAEEVAVVEGA